jgi:8-oxo-dGTP pyrophosphatase MutT (NUDIX family)
MQRYKLFYNQTVLSLIIFKYFNQRVEENTDYVVFEASLDMKQLLINFLSGNKSMYILYHNQEEENIILENIKRFFVYQRAAGGLVIKDDAVLSIYRYGYWDFPKGHVEEGETDQEAAMREVTEETGIDDLMICNDLGCTFHIFSSSDNLFVLKETHWFEMQTKNNKTPCPQIEESILYAEWIPLANLTKILEKTYLSVVDLIEKWQRQ